MPDSDQGSDLVHVVTDARGTSERIVPGLQFVERDLVVKLPGRTDFAEVRKARILQQLVEITEWQGDWAYNRRFEWRDVPLVTEGS